MTRRELGESYFKQGYNCAQAVTLTFIDVLKIDSETALKLISGFGGGFGRMREVCGAVSGMVFVLNSVIGYSDAGDNLKKMELYKNVQLLMNKFKEKNGSYVCRELIGVEAQNGGYVPEKRTEAYYKKRPCESLVGDACEILENFFKDNNLV